MFVAIREMIRGTLNKKIDSWDLRMALNQTHSYDTSDGLSLQQEVDQ